MLQGYSFTPRLPDSSPRGEALFEYKHALQLSDKDRPAPSVPAVFLAVYEDRADIFFLGRLSGHRRIVQRLVLRLPLNPDMIAVGRLDEAVMACFDGVWPERATSNNPRRGSKGDYDAPLPLVQMTGKAYGYAALELRIPHPDVPSTGASLPEARQVTLRRLVLDMLFDLEHSAVFGPHQSRLRATFRNSPATSALLDKLEYLWAYEQSIEQPSSDPTDPRRGELSRRELYWLEAVLAAGAADRLRGGWFEPDIEHEVRRVVFGNGGQRYDRSIDDRERRRRFLYVATWFLRRYDLDAFLLVVLQDLVMALGSRSAMPKILWSWPERFRRGLRRILRGGTADPPESSSARSQRGRGKHDDPPFYRVASLADFIVGAAGFGIHFAILWAVLCGLPPTRLPGGAVTISLLGAFLLTLCCRCLAQERSSPEEKAVSVRLQGHPVRLLITFALIAVGLVYVLGELAGFESEAGAWARRWVYFFVGLGAVGFGLILVLGLSVRTWRPRLLDLLRLTLPRMFLAITAAWTLMVTTEEIVKANLLVDWGLIFPTCGALLLVAWVFTSVEIQGQINSDRKAIWRASRLVAISFLISYGVGFFATNLVMPRYLFLSGFIEEKQFDIGASRFDAALPQEFDSVQDSSMDGLVQGEIAQMAKLERLHWGVNGLASLRVAYTTHLRLFGQVYFFPAFHLYTACFAMFIGLFFTLVLGGKPLTDPLKMSKGH